MRLLRSQPYNQLTKVSTETQTDPQSESEELGSSHQGEELASSVGSQQREGTKDINADDTAPEKKPVTMDYYGQEISGNETGSILKKN